MPLRQLVQVKLVEKTFFLLGFHVCCLNPSEYICNHLFKIYIYIYGYRFQGCVVLVDLVRFGDVGSRRTCDHGFHRVF